MVSSSNWVDREGGEGGREGGKEGGKEGGREGGRMTGKIHKKEPKMCAFTEKHKQLYSQSNRHWFLCCCRRTEYLALKVKYFGKDLSLKNRKVMRRIPFSLSSALWRERERERERETLLKNHLQNWCYL